MSIKQLDTILHSSLVKSKNGFHQIRIHDTGRIDFDACSSKGDEHSALHMSEYCDPEFARFLAAFVHATYVRHAEDKKELEKQLKLAKKKDVL